MASRRSLLFPVGVVAVACGWPQVALAGSFSVSPVRVSLSTKHTAELLEIRNESSDKVSLQVNAVAWSQDSTGTDVEKPTEDVVFYPQLFTLDKGKAKKIRIGLKKNEAGEVEKSYRIYFRQLPTAKSNEGTVSVLLRIGVPIFFAPARELIAGSVEGLAMDQCKVSFLTRNSGTVFMQLKKTKVVAFDAASNELFTNETPGWYLLSGVARPGAVTLPADICAKVAAVAVTSESDRGAYALREELKARPGPQAP